ncbi:MAG: hypothetical protein EON58_00950 [Alphaproteobacteria bacterium]|nr:MAG: hypothetical protein EON58_00950 [Alphaproteobacteria bacterium]
MFPSLVLGQIISAIDLQLLTASSAEAEERNAVIVDFIQSSHRRRRNVPEQDFIILHIYRSHVWPSTQYRVWTIGYSASENMWSCDEIELPTATAVVVTLGSGARTAKAYTTRWAASDAGGTSRAIFSAFCDALSSGEDRLSGGMPQLNALYTEGSPRPLGVVENNQLFLHGLPIKWSGALANIEWCDRLFNRLDPLTMKQASGARRFARPTNSGIR